MNHLEEPILTWLQQTIAENSSSVLNETASCLEFDPEGIQYIKWIYIVFGECVHSAREQASFYIGMLSLFCWILALLPQIIANFKNKDASSLSIGFLIPSTIGDTCNMIACILSGQLMTQIFVATYFVMVDVVIIGQYIFYSLKSKLKVATITILASVIFVISFLVLSNRNELNNQIVHQNTGRKLQSLKPEHMMIVKGQEGVPKHNDFVFPPNTTISMVGFIIGCICSVMYMFSRWPQIYKNFKRQSTEGLSKVFFILAIFGNLFYLISIWLFSSDGEYLLTRLPWLAETHLNVCLDTFIFCQIIYYSHRKQYKDKVEKLQNAATVVDSNNNRDSTELHVGLNEKETISTIAPSSTENNH
ncbi:predicted protein [Naegleria gruberi]|uniref:Predicted protein n=1 Tax=Naegleria gruberi TaxID=5762 RepID=D2V1H2_NAEGR|nr:uncharacterized protein NAEGRDRAFT_30232 [Naegleria gruberi]EFC49306.1 predicted protein [Naegleria gruberi]|eukprot:XP_002682050.1 predicted protein [Naegleria gruberi strain NEG-M]